jgi:hypothetical protein
MNTIFYGVVEEEKERNIERQEIYQKELESLPRGYLVVKKRGDKIYNYLQYRNGHKTVTKYLKVDTDIESIKRGIAKRKHYEELIRRLKLEYKQMCKVVKE